MKNLRGQELDRGHRREIRHWILTLLTGGLWGPIALAVAIVESNKRRIAAEQSK